MRTGWDNERPNGRPDKCQHSSCGPACTQPRHSAQTSALTKELAGQSRVGFTLERLSFYHTRVFCLFPFLSLPTLAQSFLIWVCNVRKVKPFTLFFAISCSVRSLTSQTIVLHAIVCFTIWSGTIIYECVRERVLTPTSTGFNKTKLYANTACRTFSLWDQMYPIELSNTIGWTENTK